MAYKQFCRVLYQIGETEDIVPQNKNEILKILRAQGMYASSQICGSNIWGQGQLQPSLLYTLPATNLPIDGGSSSTGAKPSFRLTSKVNWSQSELNMGQSLVLPPTDSPRTGSKGGSSTPGDIGGSNTGNQSKSLGAGCYNAENSVHTFSH